MAQDMAEAVAEAEVRLVMLMGLLVLPAMEGPTEIQQIIHMEVMVDRERLSLNIMTLKRRLCNGNFL